MSRMSRIALVTGSSSGIGAGTARALAKDGFEVICAARRADRIEALAAEIGGRAVVCDVTDAESVRRLAEQVPRLDVLVNNAGGAIGADPVETADPDDWARMYDVNVLGVLRVTQALLPALRASGAGLVVMMGSTAGRTVVPTRVSKRMSRFVVLKLWLPLTRQRSSPKATPQP